MMTCLNKNLLSYEEPEQMDDELFHVPGLANELMNTTLANAPRPNKALAFMGALAMVAHLAGRTYEDTDGTHANLYLVALAPTSMGKDEPRRTNQNLANAIGAMDSVPDEISSPEALEDALKDSPALLLQNDEADALFGAMSSAGLRSAKLNAMLLRLYSLSKGVMATRRMARVERAAVIEKPHLTLLATGVPEYVYKSLSPKALTDGLMGRCLFWETDAFCRLGHMANQPLPPAVIEVARQMWAREQAFAESGVCDPIRVRRTPEAQALVDEMYTRCDDLAEEALKRELFVASALLCRLSEKVNKLAMIGAISVSPTEPVITPEILLWAAKVVAYATKQMLYKAQAYVAEGPFDAMRKRVLRLLRKHGGSMDLFSMQRIVPWDVGTLRKVINTLHASDLIEEEMITRRNVVITLK